MKRNLFSIYIYVLYILLELQLNVLSQQEQCRMPRHSLHKNNGAKINIFTRDIFSANEILLSTKLVSVPVSPCNGKSNNKYKQNNDIK